MKYKDFIENEFKEKLSNVPKDIYNETVEYIETEYKNYIDEILTTNDLIKKSVIMENLNLLLKYLLNGPEYLLRSNVMKDEYKDKFLELSRKISSLAIRKKHEDNNFLITKEEYEKLSNEIVETYEKLQDFNKEAFKRIISESLVDLGYLKGNDCMSFRVRSS